MTDEELLEETPLGTVVRDHWVDVYYKEVLTTEQDIRRAICGAAKKDGSPCKGKPAEKYGYYCRIHRHTGAPQPTSQEIADPANVIAKRERTPLLLNDEIRMGLTTCSICTVRNQCSMYVPGDFCKIEERIFHRFLDTVKTDYDVAPIDAFMLLNAGWRFINLWRAQLAVSRMDPVDAEKTKMTWTGPRESKEFIRVMKELGLTRKERIEQQKERLGIQNMPAGATLAQVMSSPALAPGDSMTITEAKRITVKKKDDETVLIDPEE